MNSASAGPVYFIRSGCSPAIVIPGISDVAVYEMTREKANFLCSVCLINSNPFCLFPSTSISCNDQSLFMNSKNSFSVLGCSTRFVFFSIPIVDFGEFP